MVATVPIFIFHHYQKGILKITVPVQIFFQSHTMSGKDPVALSRIWVWCQNQLVGKKKMPRKEKLSKNLNIKDNFCNAK